ncbi:Dipeptidase tcpJ [Paramyrothecium foliicola]|nr:Dipeptidase tcpJ [Paramyrothecium foliicola]
MDEALEILKSVPLIDGHNDWPHLIRGFYDNVLDGRFGADKNLVGHVDIKRLLRGKSGGAFWSVYVDCPDSDDYSDDAAHFEALRDTLQQIDLVYRLIHLYKDHLGFVKQASDITALFKAGKFASLIGVEGLHQIANSPSVLRLYHQLGVRYVTLAHNKNNLYADSATSAAPAHGGLSAQGKDMIHEMNRIGMIIDLSHTSEAVMHHVLDLSAAPVIFSHSSAASVVPHPRNVPDAVLEKLRQNNGVIMISFIPSLTAENAKEAGLDHIVDHILHVAGLIGYDHLGLGSDYDGMFSAVKGIDDVSLYPDLVAKMLERGICRADVEKVLGLNIIRVFEDVEKVSAASFDELPVLGETVKQLWNDGLRAVARQAYPQAEPDLPRHDSAK